MAAAYFFASPIDVEVKLEGEELRKKVDVKLEKEKTVSCPVYYDGESVSGQVCTLFFCDRGGDNS
jgi:vacuolar protein sorting-associated protein 26